MIRDQGLTSKIWRFAVWAVAGLFILNLLAVIAVVIINSFSTRWLGTWLPAGWTTRWYFSAWKEFQLSSVVLVTFQIVFTVTVISGILGVLTAYALARRDFPGKKLIVLLFLLPLLIPPLTYGIPLATVLYQLGLGGTFWGVVLINLVPSFPFVVLVMIPFIEQIDPRIEAAARVFGAGTTSLFIRILLPLLLPGMLAALLLVLVRTIAMFELTFLISGPTTQTLVVSLYYAVFASGVRAAQSIDAMAVIYMITTLFWLVIALQFVNPTQIVARAKQQSSH
ncbi:ABC transporter permease [Rhizobium sp. RAF36]|jgi:putative spermidine/putrescine transport system permease protein|uniref:ABC transporter permease n=1 Tax=Rhizobium sp. RAF36 TaxID=3233055 RepID=UPI000DD838B9